jgi:glutathione synthase/RimK-type ligase-like ATP-grasp enzyme
MIYIFLKLFRLFLSRYSKNSSEKKDFCVFLKEYKSSSFIQNNYDAYVLSANTTENLYNYFIYAYDFCNSSDFIKSIQSAGFFNIFGSPSFKELIKNGKKNSIEEQINNVNNPIKQIDMSADNFKQLQRRFGKKRQSPISVLSRHPSHEGLRDLLINWRVRVRLGSTTEIQSKYEFIEINTIEAITNSSSKIKMRRCFSENGIPCADGIVPQNEQELVEFTNQFKDKQSVKYVTKSEFGSRGEGNRLHETLESLLDFMRTRYGRYVVERFVTHSKEYRLHVSELGCFYACRKMHKKDTPEGNRWYRNDSNCVWIVEENPEFEKPETWNEIVKASVAALKVVGLDIGAIDVKVNKKGEFIILETNSAPSFGNLTLEKYQEHIPLLVEQKINTQLNKL